MPNSKDIKGIIEKVPQTSFLNSNWKMLRPTHSIRIWI